MHFFLLIYSVVTICTIGVISTPVKHYSNPGDLESYNYSSLNEIEKRDFEYFGQLKSRPELTLISTQNLNGRLLQGYAFPQEAGKGIYIYHLEQGIPPGHEKEFPADRVEPPLETEAFLKFKEWIPHRFTQHSICVASKAVGSNYGTAKEATYVPVILGLTDLGAVISGFEKAGEDISAKGRSKKSIVMLSWSIRDSMIDDYDRYPMIRAIRQLFELGVPVVVLAGNHAQQPGFSGNLRLDVDTSPAFLSADDFPLIVVGSTDQNGAISSFSQRGDKVTSYTRGEYIQCEGLEGPVTDSGTSFSTPALAGTLATFMSQKHGKFFDATNHLTGLDFVRATKVFLMEEACQYHQEEVRSLWNLVTPQTRVQWKTYGTGQVSKLEKVKQAFLSLFYGNRSG